MKKLILLLLLIPIVQAAELHVGSGQTYSTIQSAVDAASSGDVVKIHPGTYHEAITIAKGITLEGTDVNNPPEIDGADQNFANNAHTWTKVGSKPIYKTDYEWYKAQITDEKFTTYTGGTLRAALQVYEDDHILRGYRNKNNPNYLDEFYPSGTYVDWFGMAGAYRKLSELDPANDPTEEECESYCEDRKSRGLEGGCSDRDCNPSWDLKNIHIPGRFMYDEANTDLYVWGKDEDNPSNHKYYIPVIFHLIKITADDVVLRNLVITHSSGSAVRLDYVDRVIIEDSYFISNRHDINIKNSDDITIRRNFIQDKGFWERYWYGDCKHTVIHGGDIQISGGGNIEISKNAFRGTYSMLHPANGDLDIHDNIFGNAMSVHISSSPYGVDAYRNVFHHIDDNSIGISNRDTGEPNYIYRNVFYANKRITKDGHSDIASPRSQVYLYHNTIVLSQSISNHPYRYPPYKATHYRNNIVHLRDGSMEMYWVYGGYISRGWIYEPFDNGPDTDYNLLWREPNNAWNQIARFRNDDDWSQSYKVGDFNLIQDEMGLEVNSIEAKPEFVRENEFNNVMPKDVDFDTFTNMYYKDVIAAGFVSRFNQEFNKLYHYFDVKPTSPAIDKGEVLSWPDTVTITDGKPDIGAIEYGGGCNENWDCSSWSSWSVCSAGSQSRTRTCNDLNSCGTNNGKPVESETKSCNIPSVSNLVMYLKMDNSGGNVIDNSGEGNDAVINGNPQTVAGKYGSALDFKIGDFLSITDSSTLDFDKSRGTLMMWLKPDIPIYTDWQVLAIDSDYNMEFVIQRSGHVYFYPFFNKGPNDNFNMVSNPLTADKWDHVAFTWDYSTKTGKIYINGVETNLFKENLPTKWETIAQTADWHIGGSTVKDEYFLGAIDEFKLFDGVLSTSDILGEMTHDADIDNNGCVDNTEITNFLSEWKDQKTTMIELIDAIKIWKNCS